MDDELLIVAADFANYRDIANVEYDRYIKPMVFKAQRTYIKDILGNAQYYDLWSNKADAKYQALLDGGTYTVGTETRYFIGLKPVIVLYAYELYIQSASFKVTRAGNKVKNKAESQQVTKEELDRQMQLSLNEASGYMMEVLRFMWQERTNYPLLKNHSNPKRGFRVGVALQTEVYSNDKTNTHSYNTFSGWFPNAYDYFCNFGY